MTKIIFKRPNINDGLPVTYALVIISIFSSSLTYGKVDLVLLLIGHLFIILLPLVLATYNVTIQGHIITVTKSFVGLTYESLTQHFNDIQLSRDTIGFINGISKLEFIDYTGDGYWLGDFPDCILVTLDNKSFVLGRKKDFTKLQSKLSVLKQNTS